MTSGEYRLYLERHGEAHDTIPAPPPEPSDSLPRITAEEENEPDSHQEVTAL
jgi:hypothetical protein